MPGDPWTPPGAIFVGAQGGARPHAGRLWRPGQLQGLGSQHVSGVRGRAAARGRCGAAGRGGSGVGALTGQPLGCSQSPGLGLSALPSSGIGVDPPVGSAIIPNGREGACPWEAQPLRVPHCPLRPPGARWAAPRAQSRWALRPPLLLLEWPAYTSDHLWLSGTCKPGRAPVG